MIMFETKLFSLTANCDLVYIGKIFHILTIVMHQSININGWWLPSAKNHHETASVSLMSSAKLQKRWTNVWTSHFGIYGAGTELFDSMVTDASQLPRVISYCVR